MDDSSETPDQAPQGSTKGDVKRTQQRRARVKTGCITCRIRRVKCDEARPECHRCTSTGRKCDGYAVLPMSRRDLPVAVQGKKTLLLSCRPVTTAIGFADSTEMLYFDFFRTNTAARTDQFLDSEFWQKLVPQLSHEEPAIKHAVLAISALHQQWLLYGTGTYRVDSNAMLQHGKAMADARKLLTRSKPGVQARKDEVEKVLVACILFVCFENLIGDYAQAAAHLVHGLQILQYEGAALASRGHSQNVQSLIVELLNRYDFQALTFTQTQFTLRKSSNRFNEVTPAPLPDRFESPAEIRTHLFEQISWLLAVDEVLALSREGNRQHAQKDPSEMYLEATIEHVKAQSTLDLLWQRVEEFADRQTHTEPGFRTSVTYLYLRAHYRVTDVIARTNPTGLETSWDAHLPQIKAAVEDLARLNALTNADGNKDRTMLSLDVGICIPLFVIGVKCRDPALRRRAVDILDSTHRVEGIWESRAAARVVERTIRIEEDKARELVTEALGMDTAHVDISCAADVPEEARGRIVGTTVDMVQQYAIINYAFTKSHPQVGSFVVVKEKVEF